MADSSHLDTNIITTTDSNGNTSVSVVNTNIAESSSVESVIVGGGRGQDGKEVEMRVSGGYIQWRLAGGSWANLIALSALAGADGREVEIQNSGTHIQWRYVGGAWANVVALSALIGPKGDTGVSVPTGGTTGQTLLKNSATNYDYSWATPPTAPVTSVAGKTGAITLVKGDVGLSNVDNTSDLNKPVSTATQSVLNTKEDKTKLTFIEATTTTAAATAAKVATTGGSYTPTAGDVIVLTFTLANTASNPTLNIDGSGAKSILIGNAAPSNIAVAGTKVTMWYDGTAYQLFGSQRNADSNSTYAGMTGSSTITTTATGTLAIDRFTVANYPSGLQTLTLPASAAVGSIVEVYSMAVGAVRVSAPAGDNILYPDATDTGMAGWIQIPQYGTVTLRCIVANTTWMVTSVSLEVFNNNGVTVDGYQKLRNLINQQTQSIIAFRGW